MVIAFLCIATAVMAAPSGHHPVSLGKGKIGRYQWNVTATRDGGPRGGQRPCVVVSLRDPNPTNYPPGLSSQGYSSVCSSLGASRAPNIVSAEFGDGPTKATAVGLVFAPSIHVVRLDLGTAGEREFRLRQLNREQVQTAGIRSLRYVSFALSGSLCVRRVIGYGGSNNEIYRGPITSCGEQ